MSINRRNFIKRTAVGAVTVGVGVTIASASTNPIEEVQEIKALVLDAKNSYGGDEGLRLYNLVREYPAKTIEGLAQKVKFSKRDHWKQPDIIYADILRMAGQTTTT